MLTSEQIGQLLQFLLLIAGCIYLGFQIAVIREKRRANSESTASDQKSQETNAIVVLANNFSILANQMQENTSATRDLTAQIAKNNDIEARRVEAQAQAHQATLDSQITLAKHLAATTENVQDLRQSISSINAEIGKAIADARQAVTENSKNLANDIKGAVEAQVGKLDLVPLTTKVQEIMAAATKILELLEQAIVKLDSLDANQSQMVADVRKLLGQAVTEAKTELAKPVPAEALPGPAPTNELPQAGGTP